MYLLIPMDYIMLINYVYIDSNESYNTWKLRTCWFYWVFECLQTMCWFLLGFWMLVNYVYVDSNRFFLILANYVYVDSNGIYNTCKLCIC